MSPSTCLGLTWFPGGDSRPGRWRSGAGAVIRQNSHMVAGTGSEPRHPGTGFQPRRPNPVSRRLPFVLSPVTDLRTRTETHGQITDTKINHLLRLPWRPVLPLLTSYPRRIPLALSVWTGSHWTRISKAVSAVALILWGPTVGSGTTQKTQGQRHGNGVIWSRSRSPGRFQVCLFKGSFSWRIVLGLASTVSICKVSSDNFFSEIGYSHGHNFILLVFF